jgi:hypothetical protein
MNKSFTSRAVKAGRFALILRKDQISYYLDGILTRVADVQPSFTEGDLLVLAEKISKKNEYGTARYVSESDIFKK